MLVITQKRDGILLFGLGARKSFRTGGMKFRERLTMVVDDYESIAYTFEYKQAEQLEQVVKKSKLSIGLLS